MASLAFLLGMVPSTEKVETADDKIRADYAEFQRFENSDELKHFLELEQEVKSADFAVRKRQVPKAEKTQSEEFKKEEEYKLLKKSEKIVWYFKTKKKNPFKEIARWEETFNEPFSSSSLDRKKWMTHYYWADSGLNEPYVMADDQSFLTDGKNIEFYDNKIRLVTRAEEAEGYKLHLDHGFLIGHFDYTSALISTGKSFRQKYGMIKAKIKMAPGEAQQAFWMVSETATPHIDVARFEKGKLWCNYFWSPREGHVPSKSQSKTSGAKYTSDFFIVTLEWSPNKLVWKINDKVFKTQTSGVPQEEMYLVFSTALKEGASGEGLPAAMEIDWVRVYNLKN